MTQSNSHIRFYQQMIVFIRNAIGLLDEQGREELLQFLLSQQNPDGGFKDRGERSDLYYSLFGGLMIRAWGKGHGAWSPKNGDRSPETEDRTPLPENEAVEGSNLEVRRPESGVRKSANRSLSAKQSKGAIEGTILKLKLFIAHQASPEIPGFIEQCCLALLQKELKISRFSRIRTLMKLSRSFWKERHSINLSYRSFVLFLTLDAVLPFRGILKQLYGKMLSRIEVDQHSPCSEVAAKVFLLKRLNQLCESDQELLKSFACETGGFRAFQHVEKADMLSTAVALFALDFAGSDLRLLRPPCLDFIQQNFVDGAFLSGDGDQTTDLEYTFYGLLALGVLAD